LSELDQKPEREREGEREREEKKKKKCKRISDRMKNEKKLRKGLFECVRLSCSVGQVYKNKNMFENSKKMIK
jgi:hypothetical protein